MDTTVKTRKKYSQKGSSNSWERQVQEARSVSIPAMCKRLKIDLPKVGDDGSLYGSCPLCDDVDQNFHVSPKAGGKGLFYCFSCREGGDALSLYMLIRKVSFPEAVREIT